jgi:hypothetical protein
MDDKKERSEFLSEENDLFISRIICFNENDGQAKVILDNPLMKTVYAISYDANKRKLNSKNLIGIKDFILHRSSLCCQWKKW